uniref:Uncharacterized protein n=1 Tax=Panagrolaimus sp. PS1159 TaxID=55785 RepID=A0AC35FC71_9BILA
MSKENNKPVSRKRKSMKFSYKYDLRYLLGFYVDQAARADQLRGEAEEKAAKAEERAAKVPKLEKEVETGKKLIQALINESDAKIQAEKKTVEMLQNVCKRLASRIPKELSKASMFTQTEAAKVVERGVQTAFPKTTISTQTVVRAPPAALSAAGVSSLQIRSIFSSSENANPLIQIPPVQRMNDKEFCEALKTLPNEVQTKLYLDAMSFATQILQGKEIPPQPFIMQQLIESWLHFGK